MVELLSVALEVLVALLEVAGLLSVALEVLVALLGVVELLSVALEVLVALLEVAGLLSMAIEARQMESHRLLSEGPVEQGLPRTHVNS